MTRHGRPVPVIDITALATGTPATARTSTRTALVHYRARATPAPRSVLGLRLEHATETLRCDPASFIDGGIDPARPLPWTGAPRSAWPDPVGARRRLLPDAVHAMLFPEPPRHDRRPHPPTMIEALLKERIGLDAASVGRGGSRAPWKNGARPGRTTPRPTGTCCTRCRMNCRR
jgi:chemotaxis-related protein WspB